MNEYRDVHNLTMSEIKEELKLLMDIENAKGFLHFCEHYAYVSHPTRGAVRFGESMYGWQRKAAIEFLQHPQILYVKQRQTGASSLSSLFALYRSLLFEAQNCNILSLTQRDSSEFLRRTKYSYDYLPAWLKQKTSEFAKTSIVFDHNGSKITALPSGENPGRGGSLSLLIVDEFAFYKNQKELLGAAIPALSAGMLTEFSNSTLPSQLFIISTLPRNPIDNEYLRLLHFAQSYPEESEYHLINVDVSDIPQYQSKKWHAAMLENLGERNYKIEILCQEVYDVENSLLSALAIEQLHVKPPKRCDFLLPEDIDEEGYYKDLTAMAFMKDEFDPQYNYVKGLWIWEDPIPEAEYIAVCDVSTGRSKDKSTIEVFKLATMEQVAEFEGKPNMEQFKQIIEMIVNYYNTAKLSIERTGLGQNTVDYFSETVHYEKLYWHQKSKNVYNPGFPMSSKTRDQAIAYFSGYMDKGDITVYSQRLINQIKTFGYTSSGRIEGLEGNDDLVMALVQLSYLIKCGFAASDEQIQQHLVFGTMLSEEKNEEVSVTIGIQKYWERVYDAPIEIDAASMELLETMQSLGVTIAIPR